MKKTLLTLLAALPFAVNAQVATPEKVYAAQPNTGFTAVATSEMAANAASLTVDGNNATFWETPWTPTVTPLPHTLTVTFPSSRAIDGIYIVDRANLGNSPKICTVETSTDGGTSWTQQDGVFAVPYNSTSDKLFLKFSATVSGCTNYRIIITENHAVGNNVSNIAETGILTASIADNTSWDRTGWVASASEAHASNPASLIVDGSNGTYWEANWAAPSAFPKWVKVDMGSLKSINQISYTQRNHANSRIKTGTVSFSTDDITYTAPITVTWAQNSTQNFVTIGSNLNVRYIKIDIAESFADPASVALAEIRAHYNVTLPVELASFTAKSNGSSVGLKWTTATESNASHFNVTRSTDGSNFTTIGKVNVTGSGSTYNYTDFSPVKGNNYYQLQAVDLDGTSEKSAIEVAKVAVNGNEISVKGITASSVTVNVYASKATTGTLTASNITGQKISTQAVKLAEGNNAITVSTAAAKGLIILSLNTAEGTLSKKVIK